MSNNGTGVVVHSDIISDVSKQIKITVKFRRMTEFKIRSVLMALLMKVVIWVSPFDLIFEETDDSISE